MTIRRGHDTLLASVVLAGIVLLSPAPAFAQDEAAAPDQTGWFGPTVYEQPFFEVITFYLVAGGTVISALALCVTKDIVRMAVWLFVTLAAVALLYFLLAAPFLGAIQLIVYAGGTLILLIFGVMLTSKSPWIRFETSRNELLAAGVVCAILAVGLIGTLLSTEWPGGETRADSSVPAASVESFGRELLTTYLVPFEVASVLLLVVMIGAAYLVKQEKQ